MNFRVYGSGVTIAYILVIYHKVGEAYPLFPGFYIGMTLSGTRTT